MTYDGKCWDLASDFLEDHPHIDTTENAIELASLIQSTIDEWIKDKLDNYDGPDVYMGDFPYAENH